MPDMMQELYNQLYIHLSTDMHTALNQLVAEVTPARPASSLSQPSTPGQGAQGGAAKDAAKVPGGHQLARLKGLADEAEIVSDLAAAEQYHQERLVAATNPQVIYPKSTMCQCEWHDIALPYSKRNAELRPSRPPACHNATFSTASLNKRLSVKVALGMLFVHLPSKHLISSARHHHHRQQCSRRPSTSGADPR